jgi:Holliday junction resolvase RusA-like endonuclease
MPALPTAPTLATVTSKRKASGHKLEWPEAAHAASVIFAFDPVPASRPRVTRWGTYHTKPYKNWLDQASKHLTEGFYQNQYVGEQSLLVHVETIVTKARTSKLTRPKGDVDNYAKGPLDAITKAGRHWYDDVQVEVLVSSKRFAAPGEQARTEVHIYTLS